MSKTVDLQIEKSRSLIAGLRKHLQKGGKGTITSAQIDEMEKQLGELTAATQEVDKLRDELSPKVKHMNDVLTVVKAAYADNKKMLKGFYPQEEWGDYGIPDKR